VIDRWLGPWDVLNAAFFKAPAPIGFLIAKILGRSIRKNVIAHGIGRHTLEEVCVCQVFGV
jgi:hypothetical protein